jgi:hypothetical protein
MKLMPEFIRHTVGRLYHHQFPFDECLTCRRNNAVPDDGYVWEPPSESSAGGWRRTTVVEPDNQE